MTDPGQPHDKLFKGLLELGYILRIWLRYAGGKAEALRSPPPILPLVVYHGASPWKIAHSLRDTINAPESVREIQPDFRYTLVDLGPIPNPQLSTYPPLRAGLLALKYSHRDSDTEAVLVQVFSDAQDIQSLFRMLVMYVSTVYTDVTPDQMRRAIHKVKPEWEEEMLSVAARRWMAEGEARGRVEGRAEGEAKGRAEALRRQLRRRFSAIPSQIEDRIQTASIEQLDEWADLFVDAKTLSDIFTDLAH